MVVNWCLVFGIVLFNEEVIDGFSECGSYLVICKVCFILVFCFVCFFVVILVFGEVYYGFFELV